MRWPATLVAAVDPYTRAMMRRILESEGGHVAAADNRRPAMGSIARERPDLILLGLMMPKLDDFVADEMILNYHLMHPGGESSPGDPNGAFFLIGATY